MKSRISLLLLAIALVGSTSTAHATPCSNATIHGTYAFTIRGQIVLRTALRYSLMVSPELRLMAKGI